MPRSTQVRGDGVAAEAGRALSGAMDALEQAAADAPLHRNLGDLMRMTGCGSGPGVPETG